MQAMIIEASTIEEQLTSLIKAVEDLSKHMQEQDAKLSKSTNNVENMAQIESIPTLMKLPEIQEKEESSIKYATTVNDIQINNPNMSSGARISSRHFAIPHIYLLMKS
ncbi:hypothetical protein RND71_025588 [Anisodus tanguticus]|uniref:Uncharacterized protein n=1 Tax=Anisodus tanguticus TaxID=243964 RepID=A0AAE1V5Y2_9SOLA|nr:hypothetical protein RND71_025588 [Anisodus tanguticus]